MKMLNLIKKKRIEHKYKNLEPHISELDVQKLNYQPYRDLEKRIKIFNDHSIIGKDASETYNLYLIELGNKSKPKIMITASIHGTEWQSAQYSLSFMENLRDHTFPDQVFRNYLLNNFHILFVPVVNPWGYDHTTPYARYKGRNNANKVNLNRDFQHFTQPESTHIKNIIDRYQPFFFLDCHLMAPRKDGGKNYQEVIIGNVDHHSDIYRDFIAESLSSYSEREIERWNQHTNSEHPGLSRRYLLDKKNPYTPKTFPFISELYRPVQNKDQLIAYLTDSEILKLGHATLFLFFKSAIHYYLSFGNKKN